MACPCHPRKPLLPFRFSLICWVNSVNCSYNVMTLSTSAVMFLFVTTMRGSCEEGRELYRKDWTNRVSTTCFNTSWFALKPLKSKCARNSGNGGESIAGLLSQVTDGTKPYLRPLVQREDAPSRMSVHERRSDSTWSSRGRHQKGEAVAW